MNEQIPKAKPTSEESERNAGLKDKVQEAKETIKSKTKEVVEQAQQRGEEYFEQNKERTAQRVGRVGETFRQSAARFEKEHDPNIAHYTRLVADKLEGAATYIRDRDLAQLRRDGEDLARRHPAVFFGSLFVAGLAVSRFFKASRDRATDPEEQAESEANPAAESQESQNVPSQH